MEKDLLEAQAAINKALDYLNGIEGTLVSEDAQDVLAEAIDNLTGCENTVADLFDVLSAMEAEAEDDE